MYLMGGHITLFEIPSGNNSRLVLGEGDLVKGSRIEIMGGPDPPKKPLLVIGHGAVFDSNYVRVIGGCPGGGYWAIEGGEMIANLFRGTGMEVSE